MFTFNKITNDVVNESARRREITVEFKNTLGHTKERMLSFTLTETDIAIKKAFQSVLADINTAPVPLTDITVPADVVNPPTQADLDRQAWEADVARLKKAYSDMINLGVTLTAGQLTGLNTLRSRISANFKNEYLG